MIVEKKEKLKVSLISKNIALIKHTLQSTYDF